MADFRCPKGDYTASDPSEAQAALDLSEHLLKAHCKADGVWLVPLEELTELTEIVSDVPVS